MRGTVSRRLASLGHDWPNQGYARRSSFIAVTRKEEKSSDQQLRRRCVRADACEQAQITPKSLQLDATVEADELRREQGASVSKMLRGSMVDPPATAAGNSAAISGTTVGAQVGPNQR